MMILKRISRYSVLIKGSVHESLTYRGNILLTLLGNVVYCLVSYSLWNAIFGASSVETINGMTFSDTVVYLSFANALYSIIDCNIVWGIYNEITSGNIVFNLTKPYDYQLYWMFRRLGRCVNLFCITFLPTFVIVYLISGKGIVFGINCLFFAISLLLSIAVSFSIDFIVGTLCFFTQSVWGINVVKNVIVMFFSGAVVPLDFFPDYLEKVVAFLPFQTIYNSPLKILIGYSSHIQGYCDILMRQVVWCILLLITGKICWHNLQRYLTINGG